MPYVSIRITRDGATAAQKAELVADVTATLQRVLGKRPEHTHIVIDEVEPENWGFAGVLTTEYRRKEGQAGWVSRTRCGGAAQERRAHDRAGAAGLQG